MGMFDTFFNRDGSVAIQLKAGSCLLKEYSEDDYVGDEFRDGIYVAGYNGYVVIANGIVDLVTNNKYDLTDYNLPIFSKWGYEISSLDFYKHEEDDEEREYPTSLCYDEKCYTNCPGHTFLDVANCSIDELFEELNKNKNLLNDFKKKILGDYSVNVEEYSSACHLHDIKNASCALCNNKHYKTKFTVGNQSFTLAEDDSEEALHHCNLIKDSFIQAINNMLGIKEHIMVCIVCEKELSSAYKYSTEPSCPPNDATVWYTHGNYGSTIWDEEVKNTSSYKKYRLEAYICDKCLTERASKVYTRITENGKDDIYLVGIKDSYYSQRELLRNKDKK